jgi:hypothetical protein
MGYTAFDCRIIVNDELGRTWNGETTAYCNIGPPPQNLSEETEESKKSWTVFKEISCNSS